MMRNTKAIVAISIVLAAAILSLVVRPRHVPYGEARAVVDRRCIECHSAQPTSRIYPTAPKGVRFDSAEEMRSYAPRIKARVVDERNMPLVNMTGMTDEERAILGNWVADGAPIP